MKSKLLLTSERSPKSPDFGMPTTGVVGLRTHRTAKIVAAIILLAGLIGGGFFAYSRITASQTSGSEETPLQTAQAAVGDLTLYANGTGTIIPAAQTSIGFSISGQVSEIHVKVGDQVEAGQVLAQLDDTEANIELAGAQEAMNKLTSTGAIATARQALAEAQSELDLAKETLAYLISPEVLYWEEKVAEREQILADAQAAAQTDTSEDAQRKVTEAETSLKYAQDSLAHFQKVYEYEYIKETFTQTEERRTRGGGTTTITVKLRDEETGERYILIYPPTEGEIGMARADYDLAKASVAEAQIYLDILNGAEIPDGATGSNLVTYIETRHALETAGYNLNATKLIAPISGTVTALDINVGDLVDGSSVITVSKIDQPYSLDAYLDAEDWGQVKVGYEVEVSFDIIPDQVFTGTVTNVYPALDTTSSDSGLIHVVARLDKAIPYELPSNSAASVDVIGGQAENAVLVPVEALHEIDEGKYTLFVMENGKLRLHVVEVGLQDLTRAQIISGLNAGDIVTTGVVETK